MINSAAIKMCAWNLAALLTLWLGASPRAFGSPWVEGRPPAFALAANMHLERCQERILAPSVSDFHGVETHYVPNFPGFLFTIEYRETSVGLKLNSDFLVGQLESLSRFPYFQQFGYAFWRAHAQDHQWRRAWPPEPVSYRFRLPSTSFVSAVSRFLRNSGTGVYPAMSFVSYPYIVEDPVVISAHLARRELVVYEPQIEELQERVGNFDRFWSVSKFFYHDKAVHVPFWLLAGEEIVAAVASRHLVLQRIYEIINKNLLAKRVLLEIIAAENQMVDVLSAYVQFSDLEFSLTANGALFQEDSARLFQAANSSDGTDPAVVLAALFIFTRSSRSLLEMNDNQILLHTYEQNDGQIKTRSVDLAPLLSAAQVGELRHGLEQLQLPDFEPKMDDLDAIRRELYLRLFSPR